jgi:hypothetical protein
VGAEDYAADSDFGVRGYFEQVLEKGASLILKERFGRTHAAGRAPREDYGG